ncbi:electron carrier/ protein disulfide oxidoreductase [Anaeramoeba ignava]|uniref:Electron carrier/ protein disulfide oxidoreductase n=1 Tax=Anaeramoeba ignava TaxID=1746090 RepID=A0A9Q0LBE4_ANAIG|nr:electron carrier/ protein disulfide oxidoreductase [Anaeramoeba ignava]
MGNIKTFAKQIPKNQTKQFKQTLQESTNAVVLLKQTGVFEFASEAAIKMFGAKSRKELSKQTFLNTLVIFQNHIQLPSQRVVDMVVLRAQENKGQISLDLQCRTLSGTSFWAHIKFEIIQLGSNTVFYLELQPADEPPKETFIALDLDFESKLQSENQSQEIQTLKHQIKKLKFEIQTLKSQDLSGSLQMKLGGAQQRFNDKVKENDLLSIDLEKITKEIKSYNEGAPKIIEELKVTEQTIKDLNSSIESVKNEIKQLKEDKKNEEKRNKIAELEKEFEQRKVDQELFQKQLTDSNDFLENISKIPENNETSREEEIKEIENSLEQVKEQVMEGQEWNLFEKNRDPQSQHIIEKRLKTLKNQIKQKAFENRQLLAEIEQYKQNVKTDGTNNQTQTSDALVSNSERDGEFSDISERAHSQESLKRYQSVQVTDSALEKFDENEVFNNLLVKPEILQIFKEFLCENFKQESLLFYLEVEKFRKITEVEKLKTAANEIYVKFIKTESLFEINIKKKLREEIEMLITKEAITRGMFDQSQEKMKKMIYETFIYALKISRNLFRTVNNPKEQYQPKVMKKATLLSKPRNETALNISIKFKGEIEGACLLSQELVNSVIDLFSSFYSISTEQIDFVKLSQSVVFSRFVNSTIKLQKVDLALLSEEERKSFFINIYNVLLSQSAITNGISNDKAQITRFMTENRYKIGQNFFSLLDIRDGILRNNQSHSNKQKIIPHFESGDIRTKYSIPLDPRIHFAISGFNIHSPPMRAYDPNSINQELENSTKQYIEKHMKISHKTKKALLPYIFQLFASDFGSSPKNELEWISKFYQSAEENEPLNTYEAKFLPQTFHPMVIFDTSSNIQK